MGKPKNDEYYLDDEGEIHKIESKRWEGFNGAVVAAVIGAIALLLSVLIQTPNPQGVQQPIIVVVLQTIFNNQNIPAPTATIVAIQPTLTDIPTNTPDTRATVISELTSTANSATNTPDVRGTVVAELTQTAVLTPSELPSSTNIPTNTELPPTTGFTRIDTVTVPANTNKGVRFDCQQTGTYQVMISGGTYSPWPNGSGGQWRTLIWIYVNRDVFWQLDQFGFIQPSSTGNTDSLSLGNLELTNDNQQTAEAAGKGKSTKVACASGQFLQFVVMDEQDAYANNFGSVSLDISIES